MSYTYKQLANTDVDLLRQLLKVFGDAFSEVSTYQDAVPSEEYLQKLLSKEHFIALVVRDGAKIVGGLAAYELEKFEQERSEIYIYDLAVAEAHRRKGIATALIRELQRVAKERGAYVIYVQADQGDEAALELYAKLGKKESVYHFDISVDNGAHENK